MSIMDMFRKKQQSENLPEGQTTGTPNLTTKMVYERAFKEEKEKIAKENEIEKRNRHQYKLRREEERARRAARNPLLIRMAKKIGAATKEQVSAVASNIAKQMAVRNAQRQAMNKITAKARQKEITKIMTSRAKEGVRAQFKKPRRSMFSGISRHDDSMGDLLGSNSNQGGDILGLNPKGKQPDYFGSNGGDLLGTKKAKGKFKLI